MAERGQIASLSENSDGISAAIAYVLLSYHFPSGFQCGAIDISRSFRGRSAGAEISSWIVSDRYAFRRSALGLSCDGFGRYSVKFRPYLFSDIIGRRHYRSGPVMAPNLERLRR